MTCAFMLIAMVLFAMAFIMTIFALIFRAVRCNGARSGEYKPSVPKACIVVCSVCGARMHKREDKCHACGQKGTAKEFTDGEDD